LNPAVRKPFFPDDRIREIIPMALCPVCHTPGAYVGFTSIECRNPDCEHFVLIEEIACPCCGQVGHAADGCPSFGDNTGIDMSLVDPSMLPGSADGASACPS
jgi:hypothetical protein